MATEPYIETRDAWVEFPIFDAKARSLKKAFLGKAGGTIGRNSDNVVVIEALRDITMTLRMGDRVGLVGHNGAGKSTLLRLLSGIYEPTRGRTVVRGRVAPVFDLGVGMDPEITGYENIIITRAKLSCRRESCPLASACSKKSISSSGKSSVASTKVRRCIKALRSCSIS